MTSCEYCGSEIQKEIKKCHVCSSFQGIKGVIFHWGNIVSIILALLSILALVLPPALSALKGDYSEVSATIVSADFGNYDLLLTNTGNRPAVLISAGIDVKKNNEVIAFFSIDLKDNYEKVILENKSTYLKHSSDIILPAMADKFTNETDLTVNDCALEINFSQFNSAPDKEVIEFECFYVPLEVQIPILDGVKNGLVVPGLVKVMSGRKTFLLPTQESIDWANKQINKD